MCRYWKKRYLCGCESHLFRDRCTACLRSADDFCENGEPEEEPRRSYFKCFQCLVTEDRMEKMQAQQNFFKQQEFRKGEEERKRKEAEKMRVAQREADIRRKAEERAEREREEETRRKRDLMAEQERRKKEGGAWQDVAAVGGGKKGRKGRGNGGFAGNAKGVGNGRAGSPAVEAPATAVSVSKGGVFEALTKDGIDSMEADENGVTVDKGKGKAPVRERASLQVQGASQKSQGAKNGTGTSKYDGTNGRAKYPNTNANGNGKVANNKNGTTNSTGSDDPKVTAVVRNPLPAVASASASASAPTDKPNTSITSNGTSNNSGNTPSAASKGTGIDPGGRAGVWGRKDTPKKILQNKNKKGPVAS